MKLSTIALSLLALTLSSTSAAAQTTQRLSAGKANEYGLIYTLPSTSLQVTLEVEKTVLTPGEFYRYAKKNLGLQPILEQSVSYRILSATITPTSQPNTNERYLVQFKSGSTPFIIVNDNNMPLTINTETIASTPTAPTLQPRQAQPTILQTPAAQQAVTAEMLQSTSTAKKAEAAAARIIELRQNRSEVISGTADNMPSDGQAMQLALDNLAAQEEALTAMFVGTTQISTQVATFNIQLPAEPTNGWHTTVARISELDGIVDATDLSGAPVVLTLSNIERSQLPRNEKGEEKKFPKGGLAYCIPGSANVALSYEGTTLATDKIDVAQYGVVFGLDPNLFTDKKAPAYAIFNPLTGAITELGTKQ